MSTGRLVLLTHRGLVLCQGFDPRLIGYRPIFLATRRTEQFGTGAEIRTLNSWDTTKPVTITVTPALLN